LVSGNENKIGGFPPIEGIMDSMGLCGLRFTKLNQPFDFTFAVHKNI